jgi:hypothetical protein
VLQYMLLEDYNQFSIPLDEGRRTKGPRAVIRASSSVYWSALDGPDLLLQALEIVGSSPGNP